MRMLRQGGATRFELAVATLLIAILGGMLLNRLTVYQEETEIVAVKQLVASLRSSLAVRAAYASARGGEAGLMTLAHQNPMDWLQKPPDNYRGDYNAFQKTNLQQGSWYFDYNREVLVYIPFARKSFSTGIQKILVFKVESVRVPDPVDARGRQEASTGLDRITDQTIANHNLPWR